MSGMAILCSGQGYQGAGMFDLSTLCNITRALVNLTNRCVAVE